MTALKPVFTQWFSRVFTLLLTAFFAVSSLLAGHGGEPQSAPADFTPVVRFAVCSDVHLNGDEDQAEAVRFGRLFDSAYAYAAQHPAYQKLDAVLVAGDFTAGGGEEEYERFNQVIQSHKRDETQVLTVLGNHEFIRYRDYDATIGYEMFHRYVSSETDLHTVIGGFHVIGVSYDSDGKHFKTKRDWLRQELNAAVKDDPNKPIFVFQHPHPTATVYGSINWSDPDVRLVLSNYPQVVDFSGHSHYVPNDPRSIWQGAFTAVGTGALKAFMSNLDYLQGGEDVPGDSAGYWIVEADEIGNVCLRLYDLIEDCFFQEVDYYLTDLSNAAKRQYTWGQQQARDSAPQFSSSAQIGAETTDKGETILCFPDAAGTFEAESYRITVSDSMLRPVWSQTVVSGYARAGQSGMRVNLGALPPGEYRVRIIPRSPYAKAGKALLGTVTVSE